MVRFLERPAVLPKASHVNAAIRSLPSTELGLFARPSIQPPGTTPPLESVLAAREEDSFKSPQSLDPHFHGSVLLGGNVFVEGYFRQKGLAERQQHRSTAQIATGQPWLKWDATTEAYAVQHGGAEAPLLAGYLEDGKVRLFRGLSKRDEATPGLLERLKAGDATALPPLLTGQRDALFFSPDENAARLWSQGHYVELAVDEANLSKLYAGIEQDYVEVAVPDPQVLKDAQGTVKVHDWPVAPPAPSSD